MARDPRVAGTGTLKSTRGLPVPLPNGHHVPNKIPKILKIFKSAEGAKSRGACFSTKELDHPFLGYSHGFDLEPSHEPNQSHLNNPGTDDPMP